MFSKLFFLFTYLFTYLQVNSGRQQEHLLDVNGSLNIYIYYNYCFAVIRQRLSSNARPFSLSSCYIWLPDSKHLLLPAGITGLYFCQNEYIETVYVGQPAGTPVLQVHAMLDNASERPHFYLCWMSALRRPAYISWFNLDINTGVLSLNKTLEESDFALLCELDASGAK